MVALRKPIPQDEEGFLESDAGQKWLSEAADDLLERGDITAPNAVGKAKVLVSFNRMTEALADHMSSRIDPGRCMEQILIALAKRDDGSDLYKLAVRAVGGEDVVRSIAVGLIAPHADFYRDAAIKAERVEQECGF